MKNLLEYALFISIFMMSYNDANAQNASIADEKAEKFETLFKYAYKNAIFNGAVLIIEKGEVIYKESFGNNGKDENVPISSQSQFLLASLSKQFTAAGIMILEEQGKLKYDDKVIKHLPDFPYPTITIRNMLNQTSGIPEYQGFLNRKFSEFKRSYEETGEIIKNKNIYDLFKKQKPKLDFKPNESFDYSNTNYTFLALVIEVVSKMTFADYMEQNVFNPLKMKNTFVYNEANKIKFSNRIYGYESSINMKNTKPNDIYPFINSVGDGGIYSTADDLEKWLKALNENTLLSKTTLDIAFTNSNLSSNETGPYGFGWFIRTLPFNEHKALTHSGEFVGFSNAIFNDLNEKSSIIMLSNNSSKYRPQLNSAMLRILYDLPYELPKININEVIGKIIFEKNIESAIQTYSELKLNHSKSYDFSENLLNRLGYDLIELSKLKEAVQIFKLNAISYPNSSNVYDSLGEVYLLNNQNTEALKNYKKALSLDLGNETIIKIIEKLKKG